MEYEEHTIIELPWQGPLQLPRKGAIAQSCKIRLARTGAGLLSRMYASRGYALETLLTHELHTSSLVVQIDGQVMGTLTVRSDDGALEAERLYPEFIHSLRARGASICEFGKLAMDPTVRSKRVLGGIFHVAVLVALRLRGASDIVIEVNPRHVAFYARMLGFAVAGPERLCHRVKAPAVLLHIEASTIRTCIDRFGGRPELAKTERSFYPYFFHAKDEGGLVKRLKGEH